MRLLGTSFACIGLWLLAAPARAGLVADCSPATVVAAASAERRAILLRAQRFHDLAPDYQQSNCVSVVDGRVKPRDGGACEAPDFWRTDCSGFVSCAWSLSESLGTEGFGTKGTSGGRAWAEKSWSELEPGDALNLPGTHITLFTGWLDDAHSSFCVLEEIHVAYTDPWGGLGCIATSRTVAESRARGFVPLGLTGIDDAGDSGSGALDAAGVPADASSFDEGGAGTGDGGMAFLDPSPPGNPRTRLAVLALPSTLAPLAVVGFARRRRRTRRHP